MKNEELKEEARRIFRELLEERSIEVGDGYVAVAGTTMAYKMPWEEEDSYFAMKENYPQVVWSRGREWHCDAEKDEWIELDSNAIKILDYLGDLFYKLHERYWELAEETLQDLEAMYDDKDTYDFIDWWDILETAGYDVLEEARTH